MAEPPPPLLPYAQDTAATTTVDSLMQERDIFLNDVRDRLQQAQQYAKKHYDANHRLLEFSVRDWVWLRVLNRPSQSLLPNSKNKLSPRYAGPFQILQRIGDVAYKLQLPENARIHDVFHVGVLKPFHGEPPTHPPSLPPLQHGRLLHAPERVLQTQLRRGVWHVLIKWTDMAENEATWEPVNAFKAAHPTFKLEDELFPEERRDVMVGRVYERRRRG